MSVAYEYVHVQISHMLICVDVLITQSFLKQSAYIDRGLSLGRYCDVSSYKQCYYDNNTTLWFKIKIQVNLKFIYQPFIIIFYIVKVLYLLYENIDQTFLEKKHGPMHYKIGVTCVYNEHVFFTLL